MKVSKIRALVLNFFPLVGVLYYYHYLTGGLFSYAVNAEAGISKVIVSGIRCSSA